MTHLAHIADRVLNVPLMVTPEKLSVIASILDGRIGVDASELKVVIDGAAPAAGPPGASRFVGKREYDADQNLKPYTLQGNVAIISILGSLVNRGAWIGAYSGLTSYEGLAFQLSKAVADSAVASIILDINSPGGEAVGCFELAEAVRAASKSKSVVAVVNGMACSAAYAIASAASQIISTQSGISGSIGVVLLHADYSRKLDREGITPTLIHAGARKVDGSPYAPLSDDVKAELKSDVDQFYSLFVSGVVKGRKGRMTEKSIRGTEARTYIGQAALDVGLVDAIGSFGTVLADLTRSGTIRTARSNALPLATVASTTMSPAISESPVMPATTSTTVIPKVDLKMHTAHQAVLQAHTPPTSSALPRLSSAAIDVIATVNAETRKRYGGQLADIGEDVAQSAENSTLTHGWGAVVEKLNSHQGYVS